MITIMLSTLDSPDDREFMYRVYEEYHPLMFSVAKRYCPQQADWEDLVQNSLVRLMQHVATLRTLKRCTLASYLVITIRNTFYTQLTREKKVLPQCVSLEEAYGADGAADESFTAELIERLDREALLEQLWERVSPEERFLLECKYALGYSDAELAQDLGCKPNSVRMKLTRARRSALRVLKNMEEDRADETP